VKSPDVSEGDGERPWRSWKRAVRKKLIVQQRQSIADAEVAFK